MFMCVCVCVEGGGGLQNYSNLKQIDGAEHQQRKLCFEAACARELCLRLFYPFLFVILILRGSDTYGRKAL